MPGVAIAGSPLVVCATPERTRRHVLNAELAESTLDGDSREASIDARRELGQHHTAAGDKVPLAGLT
jgi:hypothetical protein